VEQKIYPHKYTIIAIEIHKKVATMRSRHKEIREALRTLEIPLEQASKLDRKTVIKAFRHKAIETHPDQVGQTAYGQMSEKSDRDAARAEATEAFKAVNNAKDLLIKNLDTVHRMKFGRPEKPAATQQEKASAQKNQEAIRSISHSIKKFTDLYSSEIGKQSVSRTFRNQAKHEGKTLSGEDVFHRVVDKNFARNFLSQLKDSKLYNRAMPYGSSYRQNGGFFRNQPHSRLAGMMLFNTKNPEMPPLVIDLGNRNGPLTITSPNGTKIVSANVGIQPSSMFHFLTDPQNETIGLTRNDMTSTDTCNLPQQIASSKKFTVPAETQAAVKRCAQQALATTQKQTSHLDPNQNQSDARNYYMEIEDTFDNAFASGESNEPTPSTQPAGSWTRGRSSSAEQPSAEMGSEGPTTTETEEQQGSGPPTPK